MPKQRRRYEVHVAFYVYAANDDDAWRQAREWRQEMLSQQDNSPEVTRLLEKPFASLTERDVPEPSI